jgi:hypothetical protein
MICNDTNYALILLTIALAFFAGMLYGLFIKLIVGGK